MSFPVSMHPIAGVAAVVICAILGKVGSVAGSQRLAPSLQAEVDVPLWGIRPAKGGGELP